MNPMQRQAFRRILEGRAEFSSTCSHLPGQVSTGQGGVKSVLQLVFSVGGGIPSVRCGEGVKGELLTE
jgi:hypothetical protein